MLKEKNLRMTRQRRMILQQLRSVKSHPSADELYEMVRKHLPRISLGTVYRNLDILAELGEIQIIEQGGGLKRFDGESHNHYHLRCLDCGRIADAHADLTVKIPEKLETEPEFCVTGHRLELIGYCRTCRQEPVAAAA